MMVVALTLMGCAFEPAEGIWSGGSPVFRRGEVGALTHAKQKGFWVTIQIGLFSMNCLFLAQTLV